MNDRIYQAGQRLRQIREEHGLTLRDVEEQSRRIAEDLQVMDYLITAGRLSQVENINSLPGLYKLATLSFIYKMPLLELFRIYGVEIPAPTEGDGGISIDQGCFKFYRTGLDANQRRQIANLISQYFHSQGFPSYIHMDIELANHIADKLPGLVCEEAKRETS